MLSHIPPFCSPQIGFSFLLERISASSSIISTFCLQNSDFIGVLSIRPAWDAYIALGAKTAQQYGVKADHWYDANFDMGDTFDAPHPNLSARRNDDAYNSIAVYNRYGNNISAIRGISFTVKVPKGKYVGFYHRIEGVSQPEQYDRFVKMDIKPYTSRDKFKAMNFSCEAMNMNMKGSYRSCVFKTPNAIWLGMENDYTGGDLDCNDVMFEVSADLEIYNPTLLNLTSSLLANMTTSCLGRLLTRT